MNFKLVFSVLLLATVTFLVACTEDEKLIIRDIPTSEGFSIQSAGIEGVEWRNVRGWQSVEVPGGLTKVLFQLNDGAQVSVLAFPGTAGGREANLKRWREEMSTKEVTGQEQAPLAKFEWFRFLNHGKEQGLMIAVFKLAEKVLFVKLKGPAVEVERQSANFLEFCRSFRRSKVGRSS